MPQQVDFNTPERIIREAMLDAGLLQWGEDPTSEDYARYMGRLNDLVNLWQTQGIKLWVNQTVLVPLSVGVASYYLGPFGSIVSQKPPRVLFGVYVDSGGRRRELGSLSWQEYHSLTDRSAQGPVLAYHVDKGVADTRVSFWRVPDASATTGSVELLIQAQIANMVSLVDAMSFPQEWYIALRWGLADEICSGQSQATQARCEMKAKEFRQALEDWDVEDAGTRFVADGRGQGGSRFR